MESLWRIALPLPTPKLFDYLVPESFAGRLQAGMRVRVSFGKGERIGLVLGSRESSPARTLKNIGAVIDEEPIVPPSLLKVILWAADYYLTAPGEALKAALPNLLWRQRTRRRAVPTSHIPAAFGSHPQHTLTVEQQKIVEEIGTRGSHTFLLHGVTGSGKTEVYLELTRKIIADGGSVLVLVPEISLTPQLTGRFQSSLRTPIASYHSGLTDRQREQVWEEALTGTHPVVIGTRSALFLPLKNLRLIVVDEEHDSSYKQEERFRYHARDLAIVRGREEKIPVLLGSATPAMESYQHAQNKKYVYLHLPDRPLAGRMPDLRFIDLKGQDCNSLISDELAAAIDHRLKRGEQTLLFLNRRGFSSSLVCMLCGWSLQCPNCHISLTLHKQQKKILCHYCQHRQDKQPPCGACGSAHLVWVGTGTERIETELKERFPRARIARLDSDNTQKRGTLEKTLSQMKRREIDILVGTQILTKGHDYPAVTLVGVLLAESSLNFPDLRAAERTFQLITQVAGRAGRGTEPGEVLVQGFNPSHYSLRAALEQDYPGFAQRELKFRQDLGYPPFGRLIQFLFRAPTQHEASEAAEKIARALHTLLQDQAQILGPAPCPLEKLRTEYRWQLLIKTKHSFVLRPRLAAFLDVDLKNILTSKVKCTIDVDPITML